MMMMMMMMNNNMKGVEFSEAKVSTFNKVKEVEQK